MTYTGNVSPGGTPDVRELSRLIVTKVAVDEQMSNNAYVLRCRATDEQVLIDAAAEPETITRVLGDGRTTKVITTHQHRDPTKCVRVRNVPALRNVKIASDSGRRAA